ncbi:MAG TPA: TIGR04255 family protein [Solirubrobacteraceae bacterium]|jgi:uncharacterized protein (TIGR04255 family)
MSNEVYPQAPVRFVAFTAHFPLAPRLQRQENQEAVYERLAETFPLLEIVNAIQIPITFGGESVPAAPQIPQKLRMLNRERTRSVTLGPRLLAVESTDHQSYDHLRELLVDVLGALVEVAQPAGINGVALQYIDEIRHPSAHGARDWQGLIQDPLIGAVNLLDAEIEQTSAITIYKLTDAHEMRIVYGAAPEGFVVDPNGPLRVRPAGEGPFFRLDIASEWKAPGESVPPFAVDAVLAIADDLHAPIREAFENAITEDLRNHFRASPEDATPEVESVSST